MSVVPFPGSARPLEAMTADELAWQDCAQQGGIYVLQEVMRRGPTRAVVEELLRDLVKHQRQIQQAREAARRREASGAEE